MKIRTKILLSLFATAITILVSFLIFLGIKDKRDHFLITSNQKQQDLAVHAAMLMHEKYLLNLTNDYTLWDEMAEFVKTADSAWSKSNLAGVPAIHHLDGLWIIDEHLHFLVEIQDSILNLEEQGLTQPDFFSFLNKNRTAHFFIIRDSVLYEFTAGTIHSSKDISKSQTPCGFLLLCRRMDASYLGELESLSDCKISFKKDTEVNTGEFQDDSEIRSQVALYSWDHILLGNLLFTNQHLLLKSYFTLTSLTSFSYLLLSILLLALMFAALYFWINKPMKKVTESLALESSEPIRNLLHKKDEFGEIATMIQRFFEQKKELAEIIHEKNDALSSLSEAEAKNRAILNAIPDFLLKINLFGIITDYQVGHPDHLPFSEVNLIGKNLEDLFSQAVQPLIREAIRELNKTRNPYILVFQSASIKDKIRYFEATLTLTSMGDYLMVTRNITPQKEAETALHHMIEKEAELNRLKTQFITTVSHEFRTPLAAISSNIQLIELYADKWPKEKKEESYLRIQKAIKELIALLNDLSAIAKDQSGKLKINLTTFGLAAFCQELIKDTAALFETNVNIRFDFNSGVTQVVMDKDLLRHIFINLLSNAVKFSDPGEPVTFEVSDTKEGRLLFKIEDKGIGIPTEDSENIYEPFHRGNNVAAFPGTGLGLSIVKRCIEMHQGSLQIQSELKKGTTVTVILPSAMIQPNKHEKDTDH